MKKINNKIRLKYLKITVFLCLIATNNLMAQSEVTDTLASRVNIAYGSMDKRDVTAAVSTVNGNELSKNIHPSIDNALVGRLSGFTGFPVSYETGAPAYTMLIRGLKTTSDNNAPLLLIDNIAGDFSQLNVSEIESVTALKDAAALALYGSQGANGVILVTTKRGKSGRRVFNVNARTSLQETLGMRSYLNSYDYARMYNKAWEMDGNSTPFYSPEQVEGYRKTVAGEEGANPYLYPNNDFVNDFLEKYSYQQNYDINMSGGNDLARYFALVSYLRQDGMFKYGNVNDDYSSNTSYQRVNFRTNVDVNISKRISVFLDMAGRIELRHYPGGGEWWIDTNQGPIFSALNATPSNAYPVFNEDGSLGGTSTYQNNPYGQITQSGYTETNRRLFDAHAGFKVDLDDVLKGLSFTAKTGFNFNNFKKRGLWKNFKVYQYNTLDGSYSSYGNEDYGTYGGPVIDNGYYRRFNIQSQLDYAGSFDNKHYISSTLLFNSSSLSRPGNYPNYKDIAFGWRVQYNFRHRYYAELLGSYTANEAFKRGNRFGFFPGASVGWLLTEEDFLKNQKVFSFLKLRASYGTTGLDRPYGDSADYRFLYLDNWFIESGGFAFGNPQQNFAGSGETSVANPYLQWETSTKKNIGLDAELFHSILYFSADYYHDLRKGIWVKREGWIPATYGAPLPYENGGKAESKGLELILGARKKINDFSFNIRAMADYMKSNVIDLQEAYKEWDYQYATGKLIRDTWALTALGFFKDQADIDASPVQTFGTVRPGDIKYLDVNEDDVIDENDYTATGKSSYPRWTFSLNLDLEYKGFDFNMLWTGMQGRSIGMPMILGLPFHDKNATGTVFEAWTPETSETAKYPRLTTEDNANNSQWSTFWIHDGAYLRLKTMEVGYSLPGKILQKAGIEKVRFFLNGSNLLTISRVDFDPEIPNAGIYEFPATKLYTLGLNFSF